MLTRYPKALNENRVRPIPNHIAGLMLTTGVPIWTVSSHGKLTKHREGYMWIALNLIKSKKGNVCRYFQMYFSKDLRTSFKFKSRCTISSASLVKLATTYLEFGKLTNYKPLKRLRDYQYKYPETIKALKKYRIRINYIPLRID